ncbi:MAG: LamG domain-containing protein [Candidatus Nanohaloarchaea archaeon]
MTRYGQFFIITAVLIAGALLSTTTLLASSQTVDYNTVLERHATGYVSNAADEIRSEWWNVLWSMRRTVIVEERSGKFLDNESVSLAVNAHPSRLQDDCGDIRVLQDGEEQPWVNTTACQVDTYSAGIIDEPNTPYHGVARYKFDEGSGDTAGDETGNGHDGTLTGDPQWASGRFETGIATDPDDAVEISDDPALDFTGGAFTVSFWLRPRSTADGGWRQLFVKGDGTSDGGRNYAMWLRPNDNTVHFRVDPSNQGISSTDMALEPERWYHVAGVYDPDESELRFYLNGELNGTRSGVTMDDSSDNNGDLHIGSSPNYDAAEMVVDDFRIYNRTLPVEEIKGIARNGVGLDIGVDLEPRQEASLHLYYQNPSADDPGYDGSTIQTTSLAERPVATVGTARSIREIMRKMQQHIQQLDAVIGADLRLVIQRGCNSVELMSPRISLREEVC